MLSTKVQFLINPQEEHHIRRLFTQSVFNSHLHNCHSCEFIRKLGNQCVLLMRARLFSLQGFLLRDHADYVMIFRDSTAFQF